MAQTGAALTRKCRPAQEKTEAQREGVTVPTAPLLGAVLGSPEPLACAALPLEGCDGECLTWVVGKVLWLTSFSFSVDDVEVHFHGYADVLVPVLRDLNKKHVLEGKQLP